MNYLTAHFALVDRGGLREGETVLVHGAAGGVGTAALQVAKGFGARMIAVVSTHEKADLRRGRWAPTTWCCSTGSRTPSLDLTGGRGVDVVVDVVGGDAFLDSLRCSLRRAGCSWSASRRARAIPEVKVNRLLLNNIDVRGVDWGAYAMTAARLHAGSSGRPCCP